MRSLKRNVKNRRDVGRYREGLPVTRLLMVLSSFSPLFILWAIRGSGVIPEPWFGLSCLFMAALPTVVLIVRERRSRKNSDKRELVAGASDDHRSHVLVYLFAMLLPFYPQDPETIRDMASMVIAFVFIVYIFFRFDLYYTNVLFAMRGYQVFSMSPPNDENPHSGKEKLVIITRRRTLARGERLHAYRLSDNVYMED